MSKRNPHSGTTLESLLAKTGVRASARELAATKAIALELTAVMVDRQITKAELARLAGTSRSQLDRILGGFTAASMDSIDRVANVLGKQLVVRLEDLPRERKPKPAAKVTVPKLGAGRLRKGRGGPALRVTSR